LPTSASVVTCRAYFQSFELVWPLLSARGQWISCNGAKDSVGYSCRIAPDTQRARQQHEARQLQHNLCQQGISCKFVENCWSLVLFVTRDALPCGSRVAIDINSASSDTSSKVFRSDADMPAKMLPLCGLWIRDMLRVCVGQDHAGI
jgi:hypothetical protein